MGCAFGYIFPLPLVTLVGHRRHLHGRVPALLLPEISKKCSEHVLFSNWSCGKTPWTFSKFWRCHGMEGYVSHPPVASCMGSSSWPTSQLKPSLNTLQVAMSWWKWGMPTNLGSCDPRTNEMKSMAINHQPIIGMDIPSQSSKQWEHVACIGCCSGGVKKSGGKCQTFNSSPILPPFWKRNQNARHLLSGKLTWQCRMQHLSSIVDENSLLKMKDFLSLPSLVSRQASGGP